VFGRLLLALISPAVGLVALVWPVPTGLVLVDRGDLGVRGRVC
jgi:hypothetical protein